ncbi:DUF2493 domain-containing protein (plasmid) [Paenibacillus rhizovicinus]|uniref:DUF2493 domain-containing protein n=2 Tax=Paenibacillus rhizovicinus TaxID=2704463 RepID=A0A6C0PBA8_9BACL|nr:DUF2493 domain-containing protein [Paenibacillus rhizovicinus]
MIQYRDHTSRDELQVGYADTEFDLSSWWRHDANIISIQDVRDLGDQKPFRIIVAGYREFVDYPMACRWLDYYLQYTNREQIVIISGMARGADTMGEDYARERGIYIHQAAADWDRYGKSAGYMRNSEMAKEAGPGGACVCFWDGLSKGTKHMIDISKRHELLLRVVNYKTNKEMVV